MSTPLERAMVMPSVWGAKIDTTKAWADDPQYKPAYYVVHHGGGANPAGVPPYSREAECRVARSWEAWHTRKGADGSPVMRAIAYNFGAGQSGDLDYLRGPKHCNGGQYGDHNKESRAFVFILGGDQVPSLAARQKFGRLWLEEPFSGKVFCHSQVGATACPGPWLTPWVARQGWIEDLGVWSLGDEDWIISSVKVRLHRLGYRLVPQYGPVFDSGLRRQVTAFQRKHGLVSDGVVGPQTLKAMGGLLGEVYPEVHDDPAEPAPPTVPAPPALLLPGRKVWIPEVEKWRSLLVYAFDKFCRAALGRAASGYEIDYGLGVVQHESSGKHLARCHLEWLGEPPPGYDPNDETTRATGLCQHVPAHWNARSLAALGRVGNILDPLDQLEVMAWLVYHKPDKAPNWQHWPDGPQGPVLQPGSATIVRQKLAELYPETGG